MIVVFGSINVDIVTRVAAIPAPGETVIGSRYEILPGGKGANQALAARRAGASVALVGAVGHDAFGDVALQQLAAAGVDLAGVKHVEAPTGAAFITVDSHGQNAIVVAQGANADVHAGLLAGRPFAPGDLLLLQREVMDAEGARAARLARNAGARVLLNLAPGGAIPEDFLRCLDVLIMNESEARILAKAFSIGEADLDLIARTIDARFSVATVITLGENGAVAWAGGSRFTVAALAVEVIDTTGAGDVFVGVFAAALHRGAPFDAALHWGAAAGSLACTRFGAQAGAPDAQAIDAALNGLR